MNKKREPNFMVVDKSKSCDKFKPIFMVWCIYI